MFRLTRMLFVVAGVCLAACATPRPPPQVPKSTQAQEVSLVPLDGTWYGALEAGPRQIALDVEFHEQSGAIRGTLDVRDQGLRGLELREGLRTGETVAFQIVVPTGEALRFEGRVHGDVMEGTFFQGPAKVPFHLARGARPAKSQEREGEGYREVDVKFSNGPFQLGGTLTLPKGEGRPPVAVLITGSGPQDRNVDVFGFRVFEALAHELARAGLATLRFDDRGVGESGGDFLAATTEDFSTDVEAAVQFLAGRPEVDGARVGLIGHSEGGVVAPMVAARNPSVAFIVLLAAPAEPLDALLLDQVRRVSRAEGKPSAEAEHEVAVTQHALRLLKKGEDLSSMEAELLSTCTAGCENKEEWVKRERWKMESRWFRAFVAMDPAPNLRKVRCPVLALGGTLDVQVASERNLPLLRKLLRPAKAGTAKVEEIPGMNHVLQEAKTGAVSEYAQLPKALAPPVTRRIVAWLHETALVKAP